MLLLSRKFGLYKIDFLVANLQLFRRLVEVALCTFQLLLHFSHRFLLVFEPIHLVGNSLRLTGNAAVEPVDGEFFLKNLPFTLVKEYLLADYFIFFGCQFHPQPLNKRIFLSRRTGILRPRPYAERCGQY